MERTAEIMKNGTGLKRRIEIASLDPVEKYHLRQTLLLSAVPLICGLLLLLLLSVFAKLNLYYLEANGLMLEEQVRDAYFKQVEMELWSVAWYLVMQMGVTLVAAYVVMRWASAPFVTAQKTLRIALDNPTELKPSSRWLSESASFDRIIWNFALRVKNGWTGEPDTSQLPKIGANMAFLVKFCLTFVLLSVMTGYVMGIMLTSVYERIVSMALQFVNRPGVMNHFFVAQQDILSDATNLMTMLSMGVYFLVGWSISNYMATMIYVFARAARDEKFPLVLRHSDVYHGLARAMNAAHENKKSIPPR